MSLGEMVNVFVFVVPEKFARKTIGSLTVDHPRQLPVDNGPK